jgi:hypothetical protein
MIFGFVPLLIVVGLIVWIVSRSSESHGARGELTPDRGSMVGQAIVMILMLVSLVLTITGLVGLANEVIHSLRDESYTSNSGDLASAIAFIVIGVPVFGLLLRRTLRRVAGATARRDTPWAVYVHGALLLTLAGSMVTGHAALTRALGDRPFHGEDLAVFAIWVSAWAFHWFALRTRYQPRGDLSLAASSAAGLVMLAIGAGGLLARGIAFVYKPLASDVEPHGGPMATRLAVASMVVGGAVWAWHWLVNYRKAERTTLWNGFVILVGGLGGLAAAIVSTTLAGYWSLVWFFGDSSKPDWAHHFSFVPATIATAVVGVGAFSYHWFVVARLGHGAARTEPVRVFEYLSAAAGLVAAAVGVVHVVMAAVESATSPTVSQNPDSPNRWIAAVSLLAVGVPVWIVLWRRIQAFVARDRAGELRSPVRRIYLVSLFGVGGAVAMIGLIMTVTQSLRDLLEGTFGEQTIRDVRVPLGMLVAVSGLAWYHLRVYRGERTEHVAARRRQEVVLVSIDGEGLAEQLAAASGARVVQWYRTDAPTAVPIDVERLAHVIADSPADHLLVVQRPGEDVEVVPFDEHHPVPV